MKKLEVFILGIVLLSFMSNIFFLTFMPEMIATHWTMKGKVDGTMPKYAGLFMLSVIMSVTAILFINIPRIKSFQENCMRYKKVYDVFVIWFMSFLLLINVQIILWNTGVIRLKPMAVILASLVVFFLCLIWKKIAGTGTEICRLEEGTDKKR